MKQRGSARTLTRLHLGLAGIWLLLAVPTLLWWQNSVAWLVWMSLYAIVASHLAGWQAARAEREAGGE